MPSSAFSPKTYFEKLIQHWWILFLAVTIGGLVGIGLSFLRQPRYQAEARISTSVDYTILPALEDYEEDRIINEAGWVIMSDDVLLQVQEVGMRDGLDYSIETLRDQFSADRIDDLWTLRVIGQDPHVIAQLANIWADTSFQVLTSAHDAAVEASAIRAYILALESCQKQDDSGTGFALCDIDNPDVLQDELELQTSWLDQALETSLGLNPASIYVLTSYAEIPNQPFYQARGIMAFLGMLLGLVLGLVALWFILKEKSRE